MKGENSRVGEAAGSHSGRNTPDLLSGLEADQAVLAQGGASFALALYDVLRAAPGNLFFSPASVRQALAMVHAGARGRTAEELSQTLHFSLPDERLHPAYGALIRALASRVDPTAGIQLRIANALWAQRGTGFLDEFLVRLEDSYQAGLRQVNFKADPEGARGRINGWAAEQTEEKIQDLIPPGGLSASTRLVLANALYFKAVWQFPFEKSRTRPAPFLRLGGDSVQVQMMSGLGQVWLPYARANGYQAVEIPYAGREQSLLLVLPDPGRYLAVEAGLGERGLEQVVQRLAGRQISLQMPRFRIESGFQLAQALQQLGAPAAFDPARADFSGMTSRPDLFVSDVFHKGFIAVDEQGTEAAAATAALMQVTAMPEPGLELIVERPFLFAIRDVRSGVILFQGRVLDPAA